MILGSGRIRCCELHVLDSRELDLRTTYDATNIAKRPSIMKVYHDAAIRTRSEFGGLTALITLLRSHSDADRQT